MHSMTNICPSMSISMDMQIYFSLTFLSGKGSIIEDRYFCIDEKTTLKNKRYAIKLRYKAEMFTYNRCFHERCFSV